MFFCILHKKHIPANFLEKCQKPGFFVGDGEMQAEYFCESLESESLCLLCLAGWLWQKT